MLLTRCCQPRLWKLGRLLPMLHDASTGEAAEVESEVSDM